MFYESPSLNIKVIQRTEHRSVGKSYLYNDSRHWSFRRADYKVIKRYFNVLDAGCLKETSFSCAHSGVSSLWLLSRLRRFLGSTTPSLLSVLLSGPGWFSLIASIY